MKPYVTDIKRHNGVAHQVSYTAKVTYPNEPTEKVEFVGSIDGGPVVMISPAGAQVFVTDPTRFGDRLSPEWVRRFFGVSS